MAWAIPYVMLFGGVLGVAGVMLRHCYLESRKSWFFNHTRYTAEPVRVRIINNININNKEK